VFFAVKISSSYFMPFDAHAIFANLAQKEKLKGHHSAEGQAIRVLSRALSGWSAGTLSRRDVVVLCDQAVEDWLNARLKKSPWSIQSVPQVVPIALAEQWITAADAERLRSVHQLRAGDAAEISAREVEDALEFCIDLIDKHW
jgi:hypothetical protein